MSEVLSLDLVLGTSLCQMFYVLVVNLNYWTVFTHSKISSASTLKMQVLSVLQMYP